MQTTTATVRSSGCGCGSGGSGGGAGCGCGRCGGAATRTTGAFVRPRFFAGQLLTEDDLQALTGYLTGKDRLRNRLLFGPGVVCGLEVDCDPCGAGTVTVRPGYALDCCGNDIVLGCPEQVDILALVHDLRVRSLGAECGDPCKDTGSGTREYGLFVRYAEQPIEPVAPFGIDDSCPPTGCEPSRIRETLRFLAKCETPASHHYDPAARIASCLGDRDALRGIQARAARLRRYRRPMLGAIRTAGGIVPFDPGTASRYKSSLADLQRAGDGTPSTDLARKMTEWVRVLASAIMRYDLYDADGQGKLKSQYDFLNQVETDREATLGGALAKLNGTATPQVWPDPVQRTVAAAILEQAQTLVVGKDTASAGLEARLLAQGAPLNYELRAELTADLDRLRSWLLVRLDSGSAVTDCAIRPAVAGVVLPPPLPVQQPADRGHVSASELELIATAVEKLGSALSGYVAGCVCASVLPPCGDCADGDVLLATVEVKDCAVVSICATGREQWLPGGPGYAAWAPKLYEARALAAKVCCQPDPTEPVNGPVYVDDLLDNPQVRTDLDRLLELLAPAPVAQPEVSTTATELAELRAQVDKLTATVAALAAAPAPTQKGGPASVEKEPVSTEKKPAEKEPAEKEPASTEKEPAEKEPAPAKKAAPAKAAPQKSTKPASGAQSGDGES
jgi:hypothetical protein